MSATAWMVASFLDIPRIVATGHIPTQHYGERVIWTTGNTDAPAPSGFVRFGMPASDSRLWPHLDGHAAIDNIKLDGLAVELLFDGEWKPATLDQALIMAASQIIEIVKLAEAAQ